MEDQPQTPEVPVSEVKSTPEPKKQHKTNPILLVFVILFGVLLAVGLFYMIYSARNTSETNTTTTTATNTQTADTNGEDKTTTQKTETEEVKYTDTATSLGGMVENKVFYVGDGGLYSYDVVSESKVKLFATDDNDQFVRISVIDEDTLGYGKCRIVTNNFDCGLYLYNLGTKKVTLVKQFTPTEHLRDNAFYSTNRFAYLVEESAGDKIHWQIGFSDNEKESFLEDITGNVYGRGGFIEDSFVMEFSPDGKSLMQIATASVRNSSDDFNVYIYNLSSGTQQVILNATHPTWLDDDTIVYRKYQKEGLYIYDLLARSSTQIEGILGDVYYPVILPGTGKMLYSTDPVAGVYVYDFNTKLAKKVTNDAVRPLWVTSNVIVYSSVESCGENCGPEQVFNYLSVDSYDLTTNKVLGTIENAITTYGMTTEFD